MAGVPGIEAADLAGQGGGSSPPSGFLLRHPRAALARLGQADRDRLLAAPDLPAGAAAAQRAGLALLHRAADLLGRTLRVFSLRRLSCHVVLQTEKGRNDAAIVSARSLHRRHAVIVIYRAVTRSVAPVPIIVVAVSRRIAELAFGDAGDIAAEPRVVFQGLPR